MRRRWFFKLDQKVAGWTAKPLALGIAVVCALAVGTPSPSAAQTCENFVGGVCLDVKKKKVKKQTTRKKKVRQKAKPKAVAKPAPRQVAAADCVAVSAKTVGNANQVSVQSTRQSQVIIRNNCTKAVVSYVSLNRCHARPVYFDGTQNASKKTFTIKPGRRKSFVVTRPTNLESVGELTRIVHSFQGERGGYKKYGC